MQRLGGLREAIDVYRLATRHDVKLWGGTMPESGIGAQSIMALAAYPAFTFPADVEPSSRWYASAHDPVELTMDGAGYLPVSRSHGAGEIIDRDRYEHFSREVERVRA